jgi:hypothetical protein
VLEHLVAIVLVEADRSGVLGVDDDADTAGLVSDGEGARLSVDEQPLADTLPPGPSIDGESADDYYRHWPFEVSAAEEAAEGYLKSLSPAEELAVFLCIRGMCLREAGRLKEAAESFAAAARLSPGCHSREVMAAESRRWMSRKGRSETKAELRVHAVQVACDRRTALTRDSNPGPARRKGVFKHALSRNHEDGNHRWTRWTQVL